MYTPMHMVTLHDDPVFTSVYMVQYKIGRLKPGSRSLKPDGEGTAYAIPWQAHKW